MICPMLCSVVLDYVPCYPSLCCDVRFYHLVFHGSTVLCCVTCWAQRKCPPFQRGQNWLGDYCVGVSSGVSGQTEGLPRLHHGFWSGGVLGRGAAGVANRVWKRLKKQGNVPTYFSGCFVSLSVNIVHLLACQLRFAPHIRLLILT